MSIIDEIWLPVVGYEGSYEVSDWSRVRSIDRIITYRDGRKPRKFLGQILAQKFIGHYYRLGLSRDGKTTTWTVHRLVCEAFHGRRPDGRIVRHLNGDHRDNRAENLCWGTHAENTADMIRHGNAYWATQTHCVNGHEFTPENTRLSKAGRQRNCRACERERSVPKNLVRKVRRLAARAVHRCQVCGSVFQTSYRQAKFCSPDCKKVSRRVQFARKDAAA